MARVDFKDEVTGGDSQAEGSDNRLNVSSRSDSRIYYNARDEGQCYTLVFDHPLAAAGQYSAYLKNTSTDKTLVVSHVGINADDLAKFKLWFVTGTAANGVANIPANTNKASPNDASVTALEDGGGTAISGLTTDGLIDVVSLVANGHEEFRLNDAIRLGQNDAIAIEADVVTSTPECFGVIFFFFE